MRLKPADQVSSKDTDEAALALGLADGADLLLWLPTSYRDLTTAAAGGIRRARVNEAALLQITLIEQRRHKMASKRWRLSLVCVDDTGHRFNAAVFGNIWAWKDVEPDTSLLVRGVVKEFRRARTLDNPEIVDAAKAGRVVPVYRGRKGRITGEAVANLMPAAFAAERDRAVARIIAATGLDQREIARRTGYGSLYDWLRAVHAPASPDDARRAKAAAMEIALAELTAHARSVVARAPEARSVLVCRSEDLADLAQRFHGTLTDDQRAAARTIVQMVRGPRAARAQLSADVGCGKSIAFLLPMLAVARAGHQVAVMVPRQLLAEKTAAEIRSLAPDLQLQLVRPGERAQRGAVLVGTHALIGACAKSDLDLDLLVIDEQQKFSRAQREALVRPHTNVIEVSATPIPRSFAMVLAGGAELIEIQQRPFQRHVESRIVARENKRALFGYLQTLVGQGKQVAIVYPRIGDEGDDDALPDEDRADPPEAKGMLAPMVADWQTRFPGAVAVLHGKLEGAETEQEMARILRGEAKVIIATTIIELGITLPDLKALVCIEPERLGLSQLHQLRGRVARLGGKGAFFMVPGSACTEAQMERLQAVAECNNGFDLAERELALRGMGDLSADSDRQAGASVSLFPTLKLSPAMLNRAAAAREPETADGRVR